MQPTTTTTAATTSPMSSSKSHRPNRPSITAPIHWLSRNNSKSSTERAGLRLGATVVRTAEDALRDTNVRITYDAALSPSASPHHSPPLPPLPIPEEDESDLLQDTSLCPPKPTRSVPPTPSSTPSDSPQPSPRPSLKSRSSTAVEEPPLVPPVPSHIPLSAPVPPFSPILLSPPLNPGVDLAKVVITLETCTTSFKSTLATLCSRPSHLADYLTSLTRQFVNSAVSSVYSTDSADMEAFHPPQPETSKSTSIHVFLDRPSSPYAHILTFLRTPPASPEYPVTLPRAVQLSSLTQSTSTSIFNAKLETLLELRDESAFLGLDSLYKLCTEELRHRLSHALRSHARGNSQVSINAMLSPGYIPIVGNGRTSVHSLHGSVYSLHTLNEAAANDVTATKDIDQHLSDSDASDGVQEEPTCPQTPNTTSRRRSSSLTTPKVTRPSRTPPEICVQHPVRIPTPTQPEQLQPQPPSHSRSHSYSHTSPPTRTHYTHHIQTHKKSESAACLPLTRFTSSSTSDRGSGIARLHSESRPRPGPDYHPSPPPSVGLIRSPVPLGSPPAGWI